MAFDHFIPNPNTEQSWMRLGMHLSIETERILQAHAGEFKLPRDAASKFYTCIISFLTMQVKLGNHFHPREIMLFHWTMKSHYLEHIGLLAAFMHPGLASCYQDENFNKHFKQLLQSCYFGTPPFKVVNPVIAKYLDGLHLLFREGDIWAEWAMAAYLSDYFCMGRDAHFNDIFIYIWISVES